MTASPIFREVELVPFFRLEGVPVFCNVFHATESEAIAAARGDIELGICPQSSMIFNTAFDEKLVDYGVHYDASLDFSPRFREYAERLAQRLTADHDLEDKDIVEVGCGKGDFLQRLCTDGRNRGLGFDSSFDARRAGGPTTGSVRFSTAEFVGEEHSADLLICRHVLEHVSDPLPFLGNAREAVAGRSGAVYFEVPNALWTLEELGIWDLIYEHVSYFTKASLTRLFQVAGFSIRNTWIDYGDQFLGLEATPCDGFHAPRADVEVERVLVLAKEFRTSFERKRSEWGAELEHRHAAGQRIALWGAGSKGVTFLNTVAGGEHVTSVVDINPNKTGRHVAGTGQQIVAPDALRADAPDAVLIMNPIYRDEIAGMLGELGVEAELLTV